MKKSAILIVLILATGLSAGMYWNQHLCNLSDKEGNLSKRIEILQKANRIHPFNDSVHFLLGQYYFDLARIDLTDLESREKYLSLSVLHFSKSIRLNPGWYQSHFSYGQTLYYLNLFSPDEIDFYSEYKKAADLTTFDSSTYFEIGRLLFSKWSELSEQEQTSTLDILKNSVRASDMEKIESLLNIWATNDADYDVIEEVLPRDRGVYRRYADFLGEKFMAAEIRIDRLASAEYLDFVEAKRFYNLAVSELRQYKVGSSASGFVNCIRILDGIRFYQDLAGINRINHGEYSELLKFSLLGVIKSFVYRDKNLEQSDIYLQRYFEMEKEVDKLAEIEEFFISRQMTADKYVPGREINSFLLKLELDYRLNRYRSVITHAESIKALAYAIPEASRRFFIRVLQIIGDSYQKLDYIYDAGDIYRLADELDPKDYETLIRLRRNYDRLNDAAHMQQIDRRLAEIYPSEELKFNQKVIAKQQPFLQTFVLNGNESAFGLEFRFNESELRNPPLISVLFNNTVIFEDYLDESGRIAVSPRTIEGRNKLELNSLNRNVVLYRIYFARPGGQ